MPGDRGSLLEGDGAASLAVSASGLPCGNAHEDTSVRVLPPVGFDYNYIQGKLSQVDPLSLLSVRAITGVAAPLLEGECTEPEGGGVKGKGMEKSESRTTFLF